MLMAMALVCFACEKTPADQGNDDNVIPEPGFDPVAGWAMPEFDGDVESFTAPEPPFEIFPGI